MKAQRCARGRCVHHRLLTPAGGLQRQGIPHGARRTTRRVVASAAAAAAPLVRTPAARAAIFTGTYATVAGLALTVAPITTFGLLFDASQVPTAWQRVGGILFTLIGLQYLGTGLGDSKVAAADGGQAGAVDAAQAQAQVVYSRSFYTSTVWSRLFLCAGFVATVLLAQAPLNLLWLVLLNLLGALTMHRAVQRTDAALGITAPGDPRGGADEAEGLDGINDCNPLGAQ